ncbi:hypothetical protein H5410_056657 [Solanum commersonii]|uniref:Uncharacterized protein n=1 Tax=Solanum commersonii TaxID=4109 RepID=A0A9J5WKV4_SOLCO|nr:hypothetical protein H5410_056657 [Solanum commersonii]
MPSFRVRHRALKPRQINFKYLEFHAKHGHYLAKRNKSAEKTKKSKPDDRLIVLSLEGKDQFGCRKEQSVHRRAVL